MRLPWQSPYNVHEALEGSTICPYCRLPLTANPSGWFPFLYDGTINIHCAEQAKEFDIAIDASNFRPASWPLQES